MVPQNGWVLMETLSFSGALAVSFREGTSPFLPILILQVQPCSPPDLPQNSSNPIRKAFGWDWSYLQQPAIYLFGGHPWPSGAGEVGGPLASRFEV